MSDTPTKSPLNEADLDHGIRLTVRWLREHNFDTTDSGDGVSKADLITTGDALDFPHVVMVVEPRALITESLRLFDLLETRGLPPGPGTIQANFDPADGVATIMLMGINDDTLVTAGRWT